MIYQHSTLLMLTQWYPHKLNFKLPCYSTVYCTRVETACVLAVEINLLPFNWSVVSATFTLLSVSAHSTLQLFMF